MGLSPQTQTNSASMDREKACQFSCMPTPVTSDAHEMSTQRLRSALHQGIFSFLASFVICGQLRIRARCYFVVVSVSCSSIYVTRPSVDWLEVLANPPSVCLSGKTAFLPDRQFAHALGCGAGFFCGFSCIHRIMP